MDPVAAKRREERVKLAAAALSNLGVASLVTGVVGPAFVGRVQVLPVFFAILLGATLHLGGQAVLEFVVRPRPLESEL